MVRFLGLLAGVVVTVFFFVTVANIAGPVASDFFGRIAGNLLGIGVGLAVAGTYALLSFHVVAIGHNGVLLFLGRRQLKRREMPIPPLAPIDWEREEEQVRPRPQVPEDGVQEPRFPVSEGWVWLPWPFFGLEDVDVREQTEKVDEFTVVSSYQRDHQQNFVRLTVKPSVIRFRVNNPGQFLSVGPSTVRTGVRELLQNIIRSRVANMPPEDAIRATDELREEAQRRADERAAFWGVDITEILIGEVAFPESVQRDYERVIREEKQRDAETVELEHVAARISAMTAILARSLPVERAAEKAVEIVQRERGKAAIAEQRIALSPETLEAMGPLVKALVGKPSRKSKKEEEDEDESV